MDAAFGLFLLSVTLAYVYAFVGGFTDAANAIATAVGTRAFSPLQAVLLAGAFELFGALTGTAVALTIGQGIVSRVALLAAIYRAFARVERARTHRIFLNLQRVSALYMAFSHGRNDAQKPMGVLVLALASHYGWQTLQVPTWVVLSMALVASLGVASGGWRIIRTLGMRMTGLRTVQGFAAEASAATVLQIASALAIPVSTTHAITSAIVGAGTVHGHKHVRWRVVGEIAMSWVLTLPVTVLLGYAFARLLAGLLRGGSGL